LDNFRYWPEVAQINFCSNACYWGAKRTRSTESER